MKILIAEDDTISRRVLAVTLEKFGYEVVVVANGAEAWAVLRAADAPKLNGAVAEVSAVANLG